MKRKLPQPGDLIIWSSGLELVISAASQPVRHRKIGEIVFWFSYSSLITDTGRTFFDQCSIQVTGVGRHIDPKYRIKELVRAPL